MYRRRRNDRTCRALRVGSSVRVAGRTDGRAESHRINTRRIHTTTITTIIHRYTFNQRQMDGTTNN